MKGFIIVVCSLIFFITLANTGFAAKIRPVEQVITVHLDTPIFLLPKGEKFLCVFKAEFDSLLYAEALKPTYFPELRIGYKNGIISILVEGGLKDSWNNPVWSAIIDLSSGEDQAVINVAREGAKCLFNSLFKKAQQVKNSQSPAHKAGFFMVKWQALILIF